jgi:hypothetical protein
MDTNQIPSDEPRTPVTNKKPYEKPSFRFEKVFVTTALTCGKTSPITSNCTSLKSS